MNEGTARKIPQDKRELRTYLEQFDLRNPQELEINAVEIVGHVRRIMTPYVVGERGEPLRGYYTPAVERIEDAYSKKDFREAFPNALDFMIFSVELE